MAESPFSRSGKTCRSPPPTPQPRAQPTPQPQPQQPPAAAQHHEDVIPTPDIQRWMTSIEQHLTDVCTITSEGKMNSDQKQKILNLVRKVSHSTSQMAVVYQSLKQKYISAYRTIQDQETMTEHFAEIKETILESSTKPTPMPTSSSFADMVKKGSNNFVRPNNLSSVAIYPTDQMKTCDETRIMLQKIVRPEKMKIQVRGVRKTKNGGVVISTQTKEDAEKLKIAVQSSSSGLNADEPKKRKPRIVVVGVPISMSESEVLTCIYEQNVADKIPSLTLETFLSSVALSHKSGKKDAPNTNYVIEVPANVRKAVIQQDRIFINWNSCPVRDFTLVTRCYKCQQYGHAAKTCKNETETCGHCGVEGHSINNCNHKTEPSKCATCSKYKKPNNHKTGAPDCPAKKAAELRYINSVDYEGS